MILKETKKFQVPEVKTALKGMADIAIIVGGTVLLVEAIGLLTKIPNFKKTATEGIDLLKEVFWGLALISPPLLALGVAFNAMGTIGVKNFALGLADFAIIVGGTTVLITAIGALLSIPYFSEFLSTGIDSLTKTFKGLWDIAIPLAGMSAYLIVMGFASPALIASGIAGFAIVVGGLELLLVALGALS